MPKKANRLSVIYGHEAGEDSGLELTEVLFNVLDASDKVVADRQYDIAELPQAIVDRVTAYGLNKVLTDRTSDETDKVAKLDAMDSVFAMLKDGEWKKERQVGAIVVSAEVEALAEWRTGGDIAMAQKALASYDKDTRKKILANPEVVKRAAAIKERREAVQVANLDDLAK